MSRISGRSQQLGLYATMGAGAHVTFAELAALLALLGKSNPCWQARSIYSFDLGPLGEVIGKAIDALNAAVGEIDTLLSGVAARRRLPSLHWMELAAIDPVLLVAEVIRPSRSSAMPSRPR